MNICLLLFLWSVVFFMPSCRDGKNKQGRFEILNSEHTGIGFANNLRATPEFNMFKYMYFYNGAGIGAGDFNNDGLTDLFFSSNQEQNKLYLNKGKLKFRDVTRLAQIPDDKGWSTGVSVVDINNDGLLDIYVCRVGNFEILKNKNQLLICTGINPEGIPQYKEMAAEWGLDFSGFSTQAAFLDYDLDGDLDMFLLNHSVHQNGTFAVRSRFIGTYHPLSGDRIFRNDGTSFTDVTRETGIESSAISYGLGITVSDINLDGYPDLYVGNDFHENDYLYINQQNGRFQDESGNSLMHTSQFSMGVDVADINNDAFPEIITMDMLPSDPYILKRSLGEDEYNIFHMKIGYGYSHQYARNTLQLNRKNGVFSETGLYSGVYATDWSWAPLWMDFDNDGLKDLFISNGIPKRLNDIDYVNYVTNDEIQKKIRTNSVAEKEMAIIDRFPQIKLPNRFFLNKGNAAFADITGGNDSEPSTFSNGTVYADLDNDGDLDIVVNNIDEPVLIYKNTANDANGSPSMQLKLTGPPQNVNATGARVVLFTGNEIRTYEKTPVRGFMSSMEIPIHVGLLNTKTDSAFLIWPDNTYQPVSVSDTMVQMRYKSGLPPFDFNRLHRTNTNQTREVKDITKETGLAFPHQENPFVEFDREPLIPFMTSKEGPAVAVGDMNGDGLDDVFFGAAKGKKSAVFLQGKTGTFEKSRQPELERDSVYEDVDACWTDINGDQMTDLVVASGGNEYYGKSEYLQPRVYINHKGLLTRQKNAFLNIYLTASCIVPFDFTGDGLMDLFVGGRAVPWEYGDTPRSYLLQNDGTGKFRDVTATFSADLMHPGIVKHALWTDMDGNGSTDLLLSLEWGDIEVYANKNGKFTRKRLTGRNGWWNFSLPVDIDKDGDLDIIAGNLGLNSRMKATEKEPVQLYYNDFDGNGKKEQLLTYFLEGRELPFANKDELQKQIPALKKKFLYAEDFAKAQLSELFVPSRFREASKWMADYFANSLLINHGNLNFETKPLPWLAQLTPYRSAVLLDANNDGLPDVLLGGNFYENNIQMGRYDADFGSLLINEGNGKFSVSMLNGKIIKGQVRQIRKIMVGKRVAYLFGKNNDTSSLLSFLP